MCRSRRELSNAYLLAKFGFDTAENEPFQVCPLSAYRPPRSQPRNLLRDDEEEMAPPLGVKEEDAAKKAEKEEKKEEVDPIKAVEDDMKKAMDAALKARPKAPKKPGAQGSGWDDQKRAAGATHSTAGFV